MNTTPHPVQMQNINGELVEVPTTVIINAKPVEEKIDDLLVTMAFKRTPEGEATITEIQKAFEETGIDARLMIVGSIIAAQAYPGVVQLCPVPGFERVAPQDKRMRCDKFNISL